FLVQTAAFAQTRSHRKVAFLFLVVAVFGVTSSHGKPLCTKHDLLPRFFKGKPGTFPQHS
ncbi:hypothetical protein N5K37_14300, partial [Delftia tsuruhatensis]|uniref:hypothetical protein n=1 Tax=Delftia tsuruhatensis TaxID=180282 RepID=UPI0024488D50